MGEEMKKNIKKSLKRAIAVAILMPLLAFILGLCVYIVVVGDSKKEDKKWENVPYAAGEYMKGLTINEDGTFGEGISAEDLWEKMIENGSPVEEYLSSPEELMKLMNAEMITKYPRLNPDEEINWDDAMKGGSTVSQGIIQLKRRDSENHTSNLKYASPEEFQGYINEYNSSGSETAKKEALTHFTLKKNSVITNSGYLETIDGVDMKVITESGTVTFYNGDGSAMEGGSLNALGWDLSDGQCAVRGLREMGLVPYHSVIYIETQETGNSSFANGKFFYVTDTGGGLAGAHVDVYSKVPKADLVRAPYGKCNGQAKISLVETDVSWEDYLQKYHNKTLNKNNTSSNNTGNTNKNNTSSNNTGNTNKNNTSSNNTGNTNKNNTSNNNTGNTNKNNTNQNKKATATVMAVTGDGYDQEYTSSAGITYKEFKQGKGSYSQNPYWDNVIEDNGCGPTSVSILASGITNLNYTPAEVAAEMNAQPDEDKTSAKLLQREMNALGMLNTQITDNPSAEDIQNNLRNGRVMVVSVGEGTIFCRDETYYGLSGH